MTFERTANELILSGFGEFLAGLLNRITICSDPADSPQIAGRLYTEPSSDDDLNDDWKEYVQPELKHIFESAKEVVNGDLAAIEQARKAPEFTLRIPLAHAQSWISSLNQARLALAASFELTQEELERTGPVTLSSERELVLLQMSLYQTIQEFLLEAITSDEER